MSAWHEAKFGETLLTKDGMVPTSTYKPLLDADVVGIYFSAHWCGPCRGFTPVLTQCYNECRAAGKKFEVVFASSDQDQGAFDGYYGEMPWVSIPFSDRAKKERLSSDYKVRGIPTFVLLDGKTGETMTTDGRSPVAQYGAHAFPFTAAAMANAAAKKAEAKAAALASLSGVLKTSAAGAAALAANKTHIMFWFSKSMDRGSDQVQPKMAAAAKGIADKCAVIHVPFVDDAGQDGWAARQAADGLACITPAELQANGGELNAAFKSIFEPQAPHVSMITGDCSELVHEDCVREVFAFGAEGYPYTKDRITALQREAQEKADAIRKQCTEGAPGLPFLGDTLLTKEGEKDRATVVNDADIVGVYFSAHWCGPCRGFTPVLTQCYNECRAAGKKFEVVFVSSDKDEDAFKGYFGEMPWTAMPFGDRDRKNGLSQALGVRGIPSLQLFNAKTGKLLTSSGREKIGPDAAKQFPWGLL